MKPDVQQPMVNWRHFDEFNATVAPIVSVTRE